MGIFNIYQEILLSETPRLGSKTTLFCQHKEFIIGCRLVTVTRPFYSFIFKNEYPKKYECYY
jgi:hypothetical protein